MKANQLCYCSSQKIFSDCCQKYLQLSDFANTAEQLMRSRYSAFCSANIDYLINTLAPQQRQVDDISTLQQTIDSTRWLGLKIVAVKDGQPPKTTGEVEFVAFYQHQGIEQLHENSRFVQQQGRWYYLDGVQLPPIKIGRNEPCFCGSQNKFKKCHAISEN